MKGGDPSCADLVTKDKLQDLLHARLPAFQRRVAEAREIITEGLKCCQKPYIAFSGGKDSEVVVHLAIQQKPDINVIWLHQGQEFPDTEEIVYELHRKWALDLHIEYVKPDLLDLIEEYGDYGVEGRTPYKKGDVARRLIKEPAQRLIKQFGFDGVFMGLRKDEAWGRKFFLGRHGPVHLAQYDGILHINPLMNWSAKDVWAYINSNNLPYNGVYDKTLFQARDKIRTAPWAGGTMKEAGRFQFLKYYYPALFQEFAKRFPLVTTYA